MANKINIIGQRFGKLTAVRPTDVRHNGYIVWECKCDCGKTALVPTFNLRRGYTISCGCERTVDLTGQRFGKLIAVRPTGERQGGHIVWECKCDCGKTTLVHANNLQRGVTRSCGCLRSKKSTGVDI